MAKTMHWRAVPGVVHIVVHADEAPSDEEWEAYLEDATSHAKDIKGLLVYTQQHGPSAAQRARSSEAFSAIGADFNTAIMAGSRLVMGMVTALSWVIGSRVKAFSTRDFESAADYLELSGEERIQARVVLRQLARSAGRDIDAFADESGRFRKKFRS